MINIVRLLTYYNILMETNVKGKLLQIKIIFLSKRKKTLRITIRNKSWMYKIYLTKLFRFQADIKKLILILHVLKYPGFYRTEKKIIVVGLIFFLFWSLERVHLGIYFKSKIKLKIPGKEILKIKLKFFLLFQ